MTQFSAADDPARGAAFQVMRLILHEHQALWTARLAAAGLSEWTKPQWALLRAASLAPGLDQASAGAVTGTDKTTVVALVDRLERRGLLERVADPADRRRRRLYLTPAGEELLSRLAPVVLELSNELLARLTPSEQEQLNALLLRLGGLEARDEDRTGASAAQ